ncbi:MAG: aldehyde dehydrogenase [Gammaproteobacteria bacterium]|nr:MAG: aldehyde dehydrogenase [Gammaproteobacteria bacterium]
MLNITKIIQQQQDVFNTGQTSDISFRAEQLKKLKQLLQKNEKDLYAAIYEDFAKSEFETYMAELSQIYHEINLSIKNLSKWSKVKKVPTNLANYPGKSYIIPEPLGCVLVIGAWNYPYALSLIPLVSAMAAGNTVILKPSELPNRTSKIMAQIINQNFASGFLAVIEGGIDETTEILKHRFDKIFFTGSTAVGKIIYQAAAKNLSPITLELGGKSPTFVLKDCDLKISVKRIIWAKFLNAGQTCVAPDYILVDKSIEKDFLNELKQQFEKNNEFYNQDSFVKIINNNNFQRLQKLIDESKIYYGGECNKNHRYISPTILENITFDDKIMQDEVFGPILPVITFENLDDVISKIKEREKPLSCYIYGNNKKQIDKILQQISFGGGAINDSVMHLSNSNLPFGGVGNSGFGSYHGKAGFECFSHHKSILHRSNWFETSLKYPPYKKYKQNLLQLIMRI